MKQNTVNKMATLVRYNRPTFFDQAVARQLNHFFGGPNIVRYTRPETTVPVNVKESEAAFHIEVAAPGVKKENFAVKLENNTLTLSFKNEQVQEETTEKFTRKEFGYTAFERSFRLPKNVNADQIQATYVDGILKIDLPKVEVKEEKLVKEIAIA